MKKLFVIFFASIACMFSSCSILRSGGAGNTDTEIVTINKSKNYYDLDVDPNGITYTIDISTEEGRIKLNKISLKEAKNLALQEAAIKNNCARIISPKFSHLKKGKKILRVTVFGFPARYKNAAKPAQPDNNVIILR